MNTIQTHTHTRRESALNRKSLLLEKLEAEFFSRNESKLARSIHIRIGGVSVEFSTDSHALADRVKNYFSSYSGSTAPQGLLRVQVASDDPKLWEDEDPEFQILGATVVQRDFVARRVPASSTQPESAIALVAPELDDSFHNLLRWFLPPLLLRDSTFLLHGAGIIRDGRGYVLFGHSEAGKSTSAALVSQADPEAMVVGDDGVLIQMRGETPFLLSAPLGCGYSRSAPPVAAAPIAGIYTLSQSSDHAIESLSPSQGTMALLANVMNVSFDEEVDAKMSLAARFAFSGCGVHKLHFRKDPGFWDLLLRASREN